MENTTKQVAQTSGVATGNCGTCKFWGSASDEPWGRNMGMAKCNNVPKYFDVCEETGFEEPGEDYPAYHVLKAVYKGTKAVALDGSGYRAELLTTADFGCISYARIEGAESSSHKLVRSKDGTATPFDTSQVRSAVDTVTKDEREMKELGALSLMPVGSEMIDRIADAIAVRVGGYSGDIVEADYVANLVEMAIMHIGAGLAPLRDHGKRAGRT
ncbi:hypothetical protein E2P84_31150 [Burkholderia cepacia]|nr:hypothetical protein [Burkholderia cepacia]TES70146.1 hypothetical protein E2P84_31150 [Burkholderia cepacia]TES97447.1 hypothetical protein E3D36_32370 [Burkholderia cepacia]TEV19869.1 hypothetical protein E3D45_36125 [Burkholderia cepacia]TEV49456.1 hypothetical protein E3D46_36335 [Burkholderia cepacia]